MGTLLRVVDIQAHLALLIVFLSIAAHLYGKPFDMDRKNGKLLFELELTGLGVCWFTFWGGLLFFLGHEKENSVNDNVKITMTVMLMMANVIFLSYAVCTFIRECRDDQKKAKKRKSTMMNQTAVVPIGSDENKESKKSEGNNEDESFRQQSGLEKA